MKYTVKVKEVNYGAVEVDAVSAEEALAKAEAEYISGNTVWDCGDYELTDAKRVPERAKSKDYER